MKKRLIKYLLVSSLVGAVLFYALGAGVSGGFGFKLPDGSGYVVQFQLGVSHVPAPPPVAPEASDESPIERLRPQETT